MPGIVVPKKSNVMFVQHNTESGCCLAFTALFLYVQVKLTCLIFLFYYQISVCDFMA